MASKFWGDLTAGGILSFAGNVFGSRQTTPSNPVAYQAEVTSSSSYSKKQTSNIMLYIGLGGLALLLIIFSMRK